MGLEIEYRRRSANDHLRVYLETQDGTAIEHEPRKTPQLRFRILTATRAAEPSEGTALGGQLSCNTAFRRGISLTVSRDKRHI